MRSSGPEYGDENKDEFRKKRTECNSVGELIRGDAEHRVYYSRLWRIGD